MWLEVRTGPEEGTTAEVVGERFLVGRDRAAGLVLSDEKASRHHCVVTAMADGSARVEDLGSTNGTYVNGRRLDAPVSVRPGDEIRIGETILAIAPDPRERLTTVSPIPDAAETGPAPRPVQSDVGPVAPVPAPPVADRSSGTSASRIERLRLGRAVQRLTLISAILAVAVVGAITAVALLVTGVIGGGSDPLEPIAVPAPAPPVTIPVPVPVPVPVPAPAPPEPPPTEPAPPAAPPAPDVADVIEEATPSTVLVTAQRGLDPVSGGTGWVLDADDGLIVTNNHVVELGTAWTIAVGNDAQPANLVATAPCEDIALLQVDDTDALRTLPLGSQEELRLGEGVIALGYPANASSASNLTATTGVVSVVRESYDQPDVVDPPILSNVIQTDATINPGNSGGPLITLDGQLVGMNTAVLLQAGGRPIQNQFYAIGVDRIKEVLEDLRDGRSLAYPGFGFLAGSFPEDVGFDGQGFGGLVALPALRGTPAAEAGLGDQPMLVVAIDGEELDVSKRSYCAAAGERKSGDAAVFTVLVADDSRTRDVTVEFR